MQEKSIQPAIVGFQRVQVKWDSDRPQKAVLYSSASTTKKAGARISASSHSLDFAYNSCKLKDLGHGGILSGVCSGFCVTP